MKKTNFKDILIHSLELRLFIVELERMLFEFNIKTQNKTRPLPAPEERSEE